MISILFVDDELDILEGLRDALHRRASDWNMAFAQTGEGALEILSRGKFDIVVSDMQMPQMDGVTLLGYIQERYPHIIRFLLTGQADRESIVRMAPVTHQFLYKPFNPSDLIALLDRTVDLHDRIENEIVRRLIGSARCVPSAPKTALKLRQLAASQEVDMREVGLLIEHDPGLGARVLQIANSAVMGRSKHVDSIAEAVMFIGFECAQALAVANEVFRVTLESQPFARLIDATCDKAFKGAAMVSQFLVGHPLRAMGMTAALLRDCGMLAAASSNGQIYRVALDRTGKAETLCEVERTCFGVTHAELGGHLLATWGIPMPIVEAVTCHHNIEESTLDPVVMAAVHVADVVCDHPSLDRTGIIEKLNWLFIEQHFLEPEVAGWLDFCVKPTQSAA
ncbi:MAG: HDOD domain-containing protein [Armatimonadetes bacterium]|nr:HDOD domain-containing protein [Armatimonadota bacterium]